MNFFSRFFRHPKQLWIRRFNRQIHLWVGVAFSLYMLLMGTTGAALVFGAEIIKLVDPNPWSGVSLPNHPAELDQIITNLSLRYPHTHVVSVMAPTEQEPVFVAVLQAGRRRTVQCDAQTGQVIGEVHRRRSRIDWIYDLHENLLFRHPGRIANGVGAAFLVFLALTGLVNWWPGIRQWARGLRVDFRRRWRRINFDLHSATGFWSFGFLLMWALSGIYFVWPASCLAIIDRFSPIINSRPPAVVVEYQTDITALNFPTMLHQAQAREPGAKWKGIIFPASRRAPFEILFSRSQGIGRDHEDTLYFNPYNGQYISTWQYGVNQTLGDWLIWLQIPLHFGTHWGIAVKCIWAILGLSLPLLSITGIIMYWNRVQRAITSKKLA